MQIKDQRCIVFETWMQIKDPGCIVCIVFERDLNTDQGPRVHCVWKRLECKSSTKGALCLKETWMQIKNPGCIVLGRDLNADQGPRVHCVRKRLECRSRTKGALCLRLECRSRTQGALCALCLKETWIQIKDPECIVFERDLNANQAPRVHCVWKRLECRSRTQGALC